MIDIQSMLLNTFGCMELPRAPFYQYEFALRFELGGEEVSTKRPLKRFAQAFQRAEDIAQLLFQDTAALWVLSSETDYEGRSPSAKALKPLKYSTLSKKDFHHFNSTTHKENDSVFDDEYRQHWFAAKLKAPEDLPEVLWLSLAAELGIRPAIHTQLYFVDFDRKVAMHPYDDRGLDVFAMDRDALLPLFKQRRSWLLEYDREKMERVFGP